jgi:hypothetical protein
MTLEELKKKYGNRTTTTEDGCGCRVRLKSPAPRPFCSSEPLIVIYEKDDTDPSGFRTVLRNPVDHFQRVQAKMGTDARLGAVERDHPMMID